MIDLRHHIYSLAAVFLALAIGIVIGTSFARSIPSDAGERRTIQRYERVMRDLRTEIVKSTRESAEQESELKSYRDYCRAVMPMAVKNRLFWRNVAVIQTGDNDELTGSVKQSLELAGAQVMCTVDVSNSFAFDNDDAIREALTNLGPGPTGDPTSDRARLFRLLASTISTGKFSYLAPKFETAGVAVITGNCDKSCRLIVLVGGASSESKSLSQAVDAPLLAALSNIGVTAVGCEPTGTKISYVPVWHKAGIASVDNADSAMGQTSLIYALNGENASFGTKKTADRLVPRTLESE